MCIREMGEEDAGAPASPPPRNRGRRTARRASALRRPRRHSLRPSLPFSSFLSCSPLRIRIRPHLSWDGKGPTLRGKGDGGPRAAFSSPPRGGVLAAVPLVSPTLFLPLLLPLLCALPAPSARTSVVGCLPRRVGCCVFLFRPSSRTPPALRPLSRGAVREVAGSLAPSSERRSVM